MQQVPTGGPRGRLRFGRFDYAAFLTFATYAASSLAIPVVLVEMAEDLRFPLLEGGMATGGSFQIVRSLAMCASMLFAGFAAALGAPGAGPPRTVKNLTNDGLRAG